VIINDSRNQILFANSIFLRMIGLTAEQLLGRTVTELFPPEDIEVLLSHIERRQTEGHGLYEFYLPQPGGLRLPVLVTSRQINNDDGEVFAVVTATDISAQKRRRCPSSFTLFFLLLMLSLADQAIELGLPGLQRRFYQLK
jgi:PAS domain S-box-containing protein